MDDFMKSTKQAGHVAETERLAMNHEVFKASMGGLVFAPVDLSQSGKRIFDSACADGNADFACCGTIADHHSQAPGSAIFALQ